MGEVEIESKGEGGAEKQGDSWKDRGEGEIE